MENIEEIKDVMKDIASSNHVSVAALMEASLKAGNDPSKIIVDFVNYAKSKVTPIAYSEAYTKAANHLGV